MSTIRWKPKDCKNKGITQVRLNIYFCKPIIRKFGNNNSIQHFQDHLAWASFLFFLALKIEHTGCNSVSYNNRRGAYRTPLTRQMVLDLERQHKEKEARDQKERIIIDEVIAKYGYIPEWLEPHLPYELRSIGGRLEKISNDLGEVRKIMEDPITC